MNQLIYLEKDFQEFFQDLHASGLWEDGKSLSDAICYEQPEKILAQYRKEKDQEGFDLKAFHEAHFLHPASTDTQFKSDTNRPIEEHIEQLWWVLAREPEEEDYFTSRIALPYPYIVPGGRFNEIYYWDSYFTMLGLLESGKVEMIEHMVNNFAWMIKEIGFIPNGNRTYYLGRSQPPFFSLMVKLLAAKKGEAVLLDYLEALQLEYDFWMAEHDVLSAENPAARRTVRMKNGSILNRYFDNNIAPRAEMYQDDVELIEKNGSAGEQTLLNIRAACESGWDFSSRWCSLPKDLSSIHTTDLIPIDLNCLLYHLEICLQEAYDLKEDEVQSATFKEKAANRKAAILEYCWDENSSKFCDFDWKKDQPTDSIHASMAFALYFQIATEKQATHCAELIEKELLADGGLLTTNIISGQQWDAPNGWAPLQWMAILGLRNYGHDQLADQIKERWVALNEKVFKNTGKLMEKYNVMDIGLESGGGEYPVQDGFGWTNGVLLALIKDRDLT